LATTKQNWIPDASAPTNYYKVANLTVQMSTFGKTQIQAIPYLCEPSEPDIVICSDWKSLQSRQPHLSMDSCEYLSTGSSFYSQLLRHGGMMLHASAVVLDGEAYLFSAPCGTGKSTHTQLWLQKFGDRAYILNDDKPALRYENDQWYAYGTPWSGKTDLNVNRRVPVAGICVMYQARQNEIVPISGTEAIFSLFQQTVRPASAEMRALLMELLDKLLTKVPVWKMGCNMALEAAETAYKAMSTGKKKED